jgi:hypothetical protein
MPIVPWLTLANTFSLISLPWLSTKNAAIRISMMWNKYVHLTRLDNYRCLFPKGETEMYKSKNSLMAFLGMHCKSTIRTLSATVAIVVTMCAMSQAAPTLPPGNTVQQWNTIAENTVVGSGAFQAEGFIYMAYVSAAVYDAVVSIQGGYEPYGSAITADPGASTDAAAIEAAYRTLVYYFPAQATVLDSFHDEALALIPDGARKTAGLAVGLAAATNIINLRTDDGRLTPIGVTSSFSALPPDAGVWRLTPPAFAAPQTPWVGSVRPFILQRADQFLPDPPPSLQRSQWAEALNQIKKYGEATSSVRTSEQTAVARYRGSAWPWIASDGAPDSDGQHSRRRRAHLVLVREVSLSILAPSYRHRSGGGNG